MPIVFSCLRCQKTLRVGDEAAGKKARCPDCGTIQDVVTSTSELPSSTQVSPSPPVGSLPPPSNDNPFRSSESNSVNPFGDANPFSDAASQSANPYAAPLQGGFASPYSQLTYLQRRTIAESRVKGPALAMFIFQVIVLVVQVFQVLAVLLGGGNIGRNEALFTLLPVSVNLGFSAVILFGAWSMYRLRGYAWAMAAAILVTLPCNGCCIVGMPVGVWALVVLSDSIVKSAFD